MRATKWEEIVWGHCICVGLNPMNMFFLLCTIMRRYGMKFLFAYGQYIVGIHPILRICSFSATIVVTSLLTHVIVWKMKNQCEIYTCVEAIYSCIGIQPKRCHKDTYHLTRCSEPTQGLYLRGAIIFVDINTINVVFQPFFAWTRKTNKLLILHYKISHKIEYFLTYFFCKDFLPFSAPK